MMACIIKTLLTRKASLQTLHVPWMPQCKTCQQALYTYHGYRIVKLVNKPYIRAMDAVM